MERELPIKIELSIVIKQLELLNVDSGLLSVLRNTRNKLHVCSHCDGETNDSGDCLESNSTKKINKRLSI